MMKYLIDTDWLADNLSNVRLLDASWYLPTEDKDANALYQECHIQGAQFFDLDVICDLESDLPHMLPSAKRFGALVGALGISHDDTIVIYDQIGLFSAPRACWMFKVMGHKNVYVLNGGLPKWQAAGYALFNQPSAPIPCQYNANADYHWVVRVDDILNAKGQVVDARPPARFIGAAPEPRPNTRSGHIPNAINLCFQEVLNSDGTMCPPDVIRAICQNKGIDPKYPLILSCGSGVTAAVLWLALIQIGADKLRLYDGSWAEWGACHDLPIATGTV